MEDTLEVLDESELDLADEVIEQTQRTSPEKPNFAEMLDYDRKINRGYYKELPDLSVRKT